MDLQWNILNMMSNPSPNNGRKESLKLMDSILNKIIADYTEKKLSSEEFARSCRQSQVMMAELLGIERNNGRADLLEILKEKYYFVPGVMVEWEGIQNAFCELPHLENPFLES